jgi:hypothetical protein
MKRQSEGQSALQTKSRICHGREIQVTLKIIGQFSPSYEIVESLDSEKCLTDVAESQQIVDDITGKVSQQKVQA